MIAGQLSAMPDGRAPVQHGVGAARGREAGAFCRGAITVPFQIRHHQAHMPRMRVFRSIGAVMRERVLERS